MPANAAIIGEAGALPFRLLPNEAAAPWHGALTSLPSALLPPAPSEPVALISRVLLGSALEARGCSPADFTPENAFTIRPALAQAVADVRLWEQQRYAALKAPALSAETSPFARPKVLSDLERHTTMFAAFLSPAEAEERETAIQDVRQRISLAQRGRRVLQYSTRMAGAILNDLGDSLSEGPPAPVVISIVRSGKKSGRPQDP